MKKDRDTYRKNWMQNEREREGDRKSNKHTQERINRNKDIHADITDKKGKYNTINDIT